MIRSFATIFFINLIFLLPSLVLAQPVSDKVAAAYEAFLADPQLRYALAGLHVEEAGTGKVVFAANGALGLIPASTLKLATSISAYEILGTSFRYQTAFAYQKTSTGTSLLVLPSGDPSLGSWRWASTREEVVLANLTQAAAQHNIKNLTALLLDNRGWNAENIPDGWLWQDIGNYYGAGPAKLNWRENQYDVILKSGKQIGEPVQVVKTNPVLPGYTLRSELTSAAAGSGDQAYIYFPVGGTEGVIRGTIPLNQAAFKISGALPDPGRQFASTLKDSFRKAGVHLPAQTDFIEISPRALAAHTVFHTVSSPPLDSLIFWFNRKSVNLYGEAFVKTIAFAESGKASTNEGVKRIRDYWKKRGIPDAELNIVDGSGLSPLNRVTPQAQVRLLQHALKQPYYNGLYASLPVYNGMKMKSGTTRGVKGFCGYHTSADGKHYVFSFLVNNYNGSSANLVQKMYKVLDGLK